MPLYKHIDLFYRYLRFLLFSHYFSFCVTHHLAQGFVVYMYDQFGLFQVILCGSVVGYVRLDKDGIYGCFVDFMS